MKAGSGFSVNAIGALGLEPALAPTTAPSTATAPLPSTTGSDWAIPLITLGALAFVLVLGAKTIGKGL